MPSGGPLNSKLALGPSKAMKSLKHLLHPAHFLYVQNFPTSTEFYWKINAFQCFQGEWVFEGCKTITTFGDEFFIGSEGVGGQGKSKKAVGNAVWYRRHPTLWGELSETVCPTSETPCAQHLNCRRLDARVTIYWLVLQFQQTFRSNFISCSSSPRFDIIAVCLFLCVLWWSAAAGDRDARLCQWGGVNVPRLAIQPLIHNQPGSQPSLKSA